ncbi:hypothetical protein XHV734_4089 [Xanthomonas hortorum pv. vitians]|nr:hypothetical protein XHV734_4089 [Xanthomonas hortorum pv. vitians]
MVEDQSRRAGAGEGDRRYAHALIDRALAPVGARLRAMSRHR